MEWIVWGFVLVAIAKLFSGAQEETHDEGDPMQDLYDFQDESTAASVYNDQR